MTKSGSKSGSKIGQSHYLKKEIEIKEKMTEYMFHAEGENVQAGKMRHQDLFHKIRKYEKYVKGQRGRHIKDSGVSLLKKEINVTDQQMIYQKFVMHDVLILLKTSK